MVCSNFKFTVLPTICWVTQTTACRLGRFYLSHSWTTPVIIVKCHRHKHARCSLQWNHMWRVRSSYYAALPCILCMVLSSSQYLSAVTDLSIEVWMNHQHVQEQQERWERSRHIGEKEIYFILSELYGTMEHIQVYIYIYKYKEL